MRDAVQLSLPFACLDFPGRKTVALWEIAEKLGVSRNHVWEHIEAGTLTAIDTKLVQTRANLRVPVEEYRRWVLGRLTGPARRTFIAELPDDVVREIAREVAQRIGPSAA